MVMALKAVIFCQLILFSLVNDRFLAHDMEEDDEEIKQEIFPWALGPTWKSRYRSLILRRDALLQKMKFRSLVSRLTCSEVSIEGNARVESASRHLRSNFGLSDIRICC